MLNERGIAFPRISYKLFQKALHPVACMAKTNEMTNWLSW